MLPSLLTCYGAERQLLSQTSEWLTERYFSARICTWRPWATAFGR